MGEEKEFFVTYESILEEMLAVHRAKRTDYASHQDPFGNFREAERFGLSALDGVVTRMGDKWSRLANLYIRHGAHEVKGEGIEDTLLDLAAYSIIALCMWRNGERSKAARVLAFLDAMSKREDDPDPDFIQEIRDFILGVAA